MKKILFTDNAFSKEEIAGLAEKGLEVISAPGDISEDDLIKGLKDSWGYVIGGVDRATRRVIEETNLKLIIFYGVGYEDHVDMKAAGEKGIDSTC